MQTVDGIHERFEGDVQYPYADVGKPELMHISEVTQENRHSFTYTCPYCKKGLHPRLGKIAHCFAHKPGERCDMDKYIHTTAERLLKEKWDSDEPFEIKMKQHTVCKDIDNCFFYNEYGYNCITEEYITIDLKKLYSKCVVEKKYVEFIPDLCLIDETGKNEPIFIEIWSKHKNSEDKANSDYRIIEIRIKKVIELEDLPKQPITESESVTFSHFPVVEKTPTINDGPRLMRYTLYAESLKSFVDDEDVFCGNYRKEHKPKSIFEVVCTQDELHNTREFRNYCNAIAIDRGYDIRSCYLCHLYGADNRDKGYIDSTHFDPNRPIGCRRDIDNQGLIPCKPETAKNCEFFKLKDKPLKRIKSQFSNVNRYIWYKEANGAVNEEIQYRKDHWGIVGYEF